MRRIEAADAEQLARGFYDSFQAFNESVGIPQRLDFVSFESAMADMKHLSSSPAVHGVVAVEEESGAIMAGGFITPGEMYEIGPIFAHNAFKERGAAKAVMLALLDKARGDHAKSIRLNQIAANVRSFALYASLGFLPIDSWMCLEGWVTSEQASSACHSVGYQLPTGVQVRKMEDADVKTCNDLHVKVNGIGREHEIRGLISNSWVAVQDGDILAYTTGFNLIGHAVATSEELVVVLFTEVCRQLPESSPQPTLHVLGRLYPRLLQWALAAKLKLRRSCWLMVIGFYQPPQHGMTYCPCINA
jgi:RimJ/RimL family protein N-acetyltransferase